ncbi:hypothetical protein GJ744_002832 [Endocarpon pusillum]|uniref:Uncharacterized protein n=1 Tax=Endocarpon pusillum TaxID=364733 RepID=A0A8H7ABE6_9EURO|nr:hypothetical protein GJ744_002832 [Endocarpon pusillum]
MLHPAIENSGIATEASSQTLTSLGTAEFSHNNDPGLQKADNGPRPETRNDEEREDPNLIDRDGPNDPADPPNTGPNLRKRMVTMFPVSMRLTIGLTSSVFSAAGLIFFRAVQCRNRSTNPGTSLFLLGFAFDLLPGAQPPRRIGAWFHCSMLRSFAVFQISVAVAQNIYTTLVSDSAVAFSVVLRWPLLAVR